MMDQRELDSRIKSLSKAITDKEPPANVLAIMETLKNDVVATEELLRVCLDSYIPQSCEQKYLEIITDLYQPGYQSGHGSC